MPSQIPTRADRHLVLAGAYAEAARRVLAQGIVGAERLPYFAVVAHGLELGLKAILLNDGWDEEDLMLIGHDLDGCCRAVRRGQLDLSDAIGADLTAIIDALSYPHAIQCFRYPQRVPQDLPDPARALDCLQRLLDVAARQLGAANRRA
ncbi:hypothetical protein [Rhizorhapis suberifaciens]|uniref:HEPN domain-containing protein n=1 Tax=Rhizorhapis suberifaciens TaxID=13656 RepID=A0A840HZ56_9SPHN|nr:hypothetical protein [Rhizorhapis suberifaciens]MBB4642704.1 hypothetical protein [Rhizorhapis suberifaciens]